VVEGSPCFLHSLGLNPSLRESYLQLFGGPDALFADLFWTLLPPLAAVHDAAKDFLQSLGAGSGNQTFIVGIHARNGLDFRSKKLTSAEWDRLADCARALVPRADGGGAARRRAVFVVATESEGSREAAAAALGDGARFYGATLPKGDGGTVSREVLCTLHGVLFTVVLCILCALYRRQGLARRRPSFLCLYRVSIIVLQSRRRWSSERWALACTRVLRTESHNPSAYPSAYPYAYPYAHPYAAHTPAPPLPSLLVCSTRRVHTLYFILACVLDAQGSRRSLLVALYGIYILYVYALYCAQGARRSLLELLLVSLSDAKVLTPMSSFSEVSTALARGVGRGLYFHPDPSRKFHYESAREVLDSCFLPWTMDMPGSMDLHTQIDQQPCAAEVRRADSTLWTHPTGIRFLDGRTALPDAVSKKVTSY